MRCLVLLACFLCVATTAVVAQNDDDALAGSLIELWADQNDSETVPDDVADQLYDLIDNPVNLNDTLSDRLALLPFLSDFQREAIRAYIAQYGQLVSLAELEFINGFDSTTIGLLSHYAIVQTFNPHESLSLANIFRQGRSNLRTGFKLTTPYSRGYKEDIYAGSPLRAYFRYSFNYRDRVSFQLSGDKDPGESFRFAMPDKENVGGGQYGFDFYGYHLMINDFAIVKRAIVGRYHLQFGQGLTLWSGFAPWMSGEMPLRRFGQGIRPASALCEYGYLNGVAATLSLVPKMLEATVFYSNVDRDATANGSDTLDGDIHFQSIYQSGYHRTDNEISKKGVLNEQLIGSHIAFKRSNLNIGATAYATMLGSDIVPADYTYNCFAFSGAHNFNAGIDAAWRYRRLILFGEMAAAYNHNLASADFQFLPFAALSGMQLRLDADNMFSAVYRYGSPTYQNLYANSVGQSSNVQNGGDFMLFFNTRLSASASLQLTADYFRHPWMLYRVYGPSSGVDYRVKLSNFFGSNSCLNVQYRYKSNQRNSDGDIYYIERCNRQQLNLSFNHQVAAWKLVSRVVVSDFRCEDHEAQHGFMLSQDVIYSATVAGRPLAVNTRLAVFDVGGYDARIYAYESDLMYEFAVPMLNGKGVRTYIVCRRDISENISFAVRYGFFAYPTQSSMGSSYDLIQGNMKHEFKAQLRLRW